MNERWLPPTLARGLSGTGAWNAVVALDGQAIPLAPDGATLRCRLRDPARIDGRAAVFAYDAAGPRFLVAVREFPFEALYGVGLAASDLPALPAGLRQALIEGMIAEVAALAGLDAASGPRVVDDGADGFAQGEHEAAQWFEVLLELPDGARIVLDVAAPRRDAASAAAWLASRHTPVRAAAERTVPVAADFLLGSATVAVGDLHALEPGDVIVMAARPGERSCIRAAGRAFLFERGEDGWLCIAAAEAGRAAPRLAVKGRDQDMAVDDAQALTGDGSGGSGDDGPATEAAIGIGDLSVAMDFDIGRVMVPLSELSRWQPGTVVDLDPPRPGEGLEVTIRAGGEAIGSGDVVRIDDRIGVRITRLFLRR